MRKRGSKQVIFIFFLQFVCGNVHASDFSQVYSYKTVALGLGGAYRALSEGSTGMLLNPAGMAVKKGEVSFTGDFVGSGFGNAKTYSAGAVDYKASQYLAMGIEYDHSNFSNGNDVTVNQITLGAATSFSDVIFVGGNLKGFFSTVNSPTLSGPDGVDMDIGITVHPIPFISLALTTQNIFLGHGHEEFPLLLGFGTALNLAPMGRVAVDLVRDFSTSSPNKLNSYFGGEMRVSEGVYFRGGFGLDRIQNNNFYSLGATVAGPMLNLNFTYQRRLNTSDNTYAFGLELKV